MAERHPRRDRIDSQVKDGLQKLARRDLRMVALLAFVVGVMLHACVIYAVLGSGGGGGSSAGSTGGSSPGVKITPIAQKAASPTRLPDRTNCEQIRGTDYRSEAERSWFRQNCAGGG